ncbi:sensor histidine kinase [Streptomyces wuyuanensis]|uniref:sensor histidine kinase n=1 Tax=Streptomyces wuyuanensis TaxID=1196353 RepID=UPI00381C402E
MSTAGPGPVPTPRRTLRDTSRRTALTVDVLLTAAAALEVLTWYGHHDMTSALVCPPALLALLVRRRFPVPVLLATLPSMATGDLWLAPMIALFTVASGSAGRAAVIGSTAAVFGAALWSGYAVDTGSLGWGDHLFAVEVALMFSVGPAGLGLLARTRSRLRSRLADLTASQSHGRRLEAERAVAQERARMAREMHDTVSYHLGIIAAQSGALWATATDEVIREDAETIRRHSADAMAELRTIVGVLRRSSGRTDDDSPGLERLPALVHEARLDAGLDLVLPPAPCSPAVERAAYRTVQEALTNVRKHAPGAPVTVTVRPTPRGDALLVEIRNGPVPDAVRPVVPDATTGGYGLTGLKERTALVNGTFRAGGTPEGGFVVRSEIPLVPAPARGTTPQRASAPEASDARSYTDTCRRLDAV